MSLVTTPHINADKDAFSQDSTDAGRPAEI